MTGNFWGRVASRQARLCAALLFGAAFALYVHTTAPGMGFVDSGELVTAAYFLGIPHPPGFPLYVLIAHAATRLPLGSVARRVNLASALFGALAVAVFFSIAWQSACAGGTGARRVEFPLRLERPKVGNSRRLPARRYL